MPPLTGETERTAQLRLAQDGLTLAAVSEIRSDDYPTDVVVAQQPPAKSRRLERDRCSSIAAGAARPT